MSETQSGSAVDADRPRVLTVVSCAATKQDLDDGETVAARNLYTSNTHVCKDRFASHSDGYYIASAKYGLIHADALVSWYDQTLDEMSEEQVERWGETVATGIAAAVDDEGYDAVVILGGWSYVEPLEPHYGSIDADILTPWQTSEDVTGIGRAMAWCNEESRWPENVSSVDEIAEVVG